MIRTNSEINDLLVELEGVKKGFYENLIARFYNRDKPGRTASLSSTQLYNVGFVLKTGSLKEASIALSTDPNRKLGDSLVISTRTFELISAVEGYNPDFFISAGYHEVKGVLRPFKEGCENSEFIQAALAKLPKDKKPYWDACHEEYQAGSLSKFTSETKIMSLLITILNPDILDTQKLTLRKDITKENILSIDNESALKIAFSILKGVCIENGLDFGACKRNFYHALEEKPKSENVSKQDDILFSEEGKQELLRAFKNLVDANLVSREAALEAFRYKTYKGDISDTPRLSKDGERAKELVEGRNRTSESLGQAVNGGRTVTPDDKAKADLFMRRFRPEALDQTSIKKGP